MGIITIKKKTLISHTFITLLHHNLILFSQKLKLFGCTISGTFMTETFKIAIHVSTQRDPVNGYGALKLSLFRNPLTRAPVISVGRK